MTRRPPWLDRKITPSRHREMERILGALSLSTVCREACCPNISECYGRGEATFLILGRECTRRCAFCAVSSALPSPPDPDEPRRVAEGVEALRLSHVVITSPTRDDLPDGGSSHYAATVEAIRLRSPETTVELLIPDFQGDRGAIQTVIDASPPIVGHNVETVPRLYAVRDGASYNRSLGVLETLSRCGFRGVKSGIMLGLGETITEVMRVMEDLRRVGCTLLSIGQYLAPSRRHHPVIRHIPPDDFQRLEEAAYTLGFSHVESGPYVRSSFNAARYHEKAGEVPESPQLDV
ncbi:MAG: lipoyl synthase [Desulfuromonadia bacterium]